MLGGFALRLYRLGVESLWYDETVSLLLARDDVAELIRHTAGDIHPPFYYLLLHFWGQFVGWSEFSSAFLSLFFGVLLIVLVYRVTPTLALPRSTGEAVGVIAALLVAISPYNVAYSQEVRMYTLGAALGLASVYLMLRMLRVPKLFTLDFFVFFVVTALGIYTLYYFIFLIGFEYVCVGIAYLAKRIAPRASTARSTNWKFAPEPGTPPASAPEPAFGVRGAFGVRIWIFVVSQ